MDFTPQLTGSFSAAHARYCQLFADDVAEATPPLLPIPLRRLVAVYLAPTRSEFSQLAFCPAVDSDRDFGGWFLEWEGCYLILTHPVREYPYSGISGGGPGVSTDDFLTDDDLDDLTYLAARVHCAAVDDTWPADLAILLAELLNYRFKLLAQKTFREAWQKLITMICE